MLLNSARTPYELSVIMATYNDNIDFLHQCIESVLNQTVKNFELIIVVEPDEVNIDYLQNLPARNHNVKILKNKSRRGVSGSRNRGILESSGEYIAIVDGDDYCDITRFEKQILILNNNPEISIVGSNIYLVDKNNNVVGSRYFPELHKNIRRSFLVKQPVFNPTIMVRKKDFDQLGLFDEKFTKAEDFELWLRFLAAGKKMYNLQEKLIYYRILTNSNEKRGVLHFKNIYIARKRYSRLIWPLYERFLSLFVYFVISIFPNFLLDFLLNLKIINNIKNIKVHSLSN